MQAKRILVLILYLILAISIVGWSLAQADLAFAQYAVPQRSLKTIVKGQAFGGQLAADQMPSLPQAFVTSQASLAADAATCAQWHNILAGDTLAKIGRRYGISWRKLAEINGLRNPNLIYAGARLCLSTDNGSPLPTPTPGTPARIPTFSIVEIVRDQSVTISTKNFPANDRFIVRMGLIGTRGINGIEVERIDSEEGGSFTATFDIPSRLKGDSRISIRLESPTSGYYSYNWFYNTTTN